MSKFYLSIFLLLLFGGGWWLSDSYTPATNKEAVPTTAPKPPEQYQVFDADFEIPDVWVQDQHEENRRFTALLDHEKAVFVQFMFTSCPTICPVMSGHFAVFQEKIEEAKADIQLLSVSIDTKYDTPDRLAEYAEQFEAQPYWTFLTGKKEDIQKLQYAFDNYTDNKMSHRPVTFFRPPGSASWKVFEGFVSGGALWEEYARLNTL